MLLGDVLSSAYQQAQLGLGVFSPKTVSVGDLFAGALVPGLVLVGLYIGYIAVTALLRPERAPARRDPEPSAGEREGAPLARREPSAGEREGAPLARREPSAGEPEGLAPRNKESTDGPPAVPLRQLIRGLAPPILLIAAVLGSILAGFATPTEAAGVGATGALLLAVAYRALSWSVLREIGAATVKTTSMVFFILIGASVFSLVFRGYGGDELVAGIFADMPGGVLGATVIVMVVIFLLGFLLDFIEITYVVVPIVGPVLLAMGLDPVWLGVMIAVNLQTSFLTPPFGFSLFYLRGVAPPEVATLDIYRGAAPFIVLQLGLLALLALAPALATWLPGVLY